MIAIRDSDGRFGCLGAKTPSPSVGIHHKCLTTYSLREDVVSPCEFHTAADCIRKLQLGKQGGVLFGDCGRMIRSKILNRVLVAGLAKPHLGDKIPRVGGRAITMSDDPSAHLLGQCFKIHHMC